MSSNNGGLSQVNVSTSEMPIIPLPEKSQKKYNLALKNFMNWRKKKHIDALDENTFMAYFIKLSRTYKSSSLWTTYSMLRRTIKISHNINLEEYSKLREYLKNMSEGQHVKKTKHFTSDEINRFIDEAPDQSYLGTKVVEITNFIINETVFHNKFYII